jgi:hypothetical protein
MHHFYERMSVTFIIYIGYFTYVEDACSLRFLVRTTICGSPRPRDERYLPVTALY